MLKSPISRRGAIVLAAGAVTAMVVKAPPAGAKPRPAECVADLMGAA